MFWRSKKPTGPDLGLIKEFAAPWDRQSPPVFVGRKEEIGIVEENCRRALDLYRRGKKTGGHIVVFRGAPGAGKSSLLEHLGKFWIGENDPLVISVPARILKNSAALVRKIGEHVFPSEAKELDQKTVLTTRGGIGGGLPIGIERSQTGETGPMQLEFDVLAKLKPAKKWNRPVCLLVDETQTVTKGHRDCLRELHLGEHGLPIVTVCAGLADSAEKLRQAISPRLTLRNMYTLAALPPEEVQSCVKQMFGRCRVNYTSDQLERIGGEIATRSEGWPQHVRTETAALFGGLAETQGDLGTVDFAAVERQAAAYREDSYLARQSEEIGDSILLVGALLKETPRAGLHKLKARRILRNKIKADEEGWDLPKGMDATDFLDHLIHQGILQPDRTKRLSCPIPSLQTWLINQADAANQENAVTESQPSTSGNRSALETTMNKAPDQLKPDQKRRNGPDQDRGTER